MEINILLSSSKSSPQHSWRVFDAKPAAAVRFRHLRGLCSVSSGRARQIARRLFLNAATNCLVFRVSERPIIMLEGLRPASFRIARKSYPDPAISLSALSLSPPLIVGFAIACDVCSARNVANSQLHPRHMVACPPRFLKNS